MVAVTNNFKSRQLNTAGGLLQTHVRGERIGVGLVGEEILRESTVVGDSGDISEIDVAHLALDPGRVDGRLHGIDERISVENYEKVPVFFEALLRRAAVAAP